jgi:hypothetical protein
VEEPPSPEINQNRDKIRSSKFIMSVTNSTLYDDYGLLITNQNIVP